MKVVAFNGSPRKKNNTAILLEKALEGAKSKGAETELVHLYDYQYKGCVSCFACKVKNSKTNGLCAYQDAMTPLLQKALGADVLLFGSPVYYDYPTAQLRAFLERLMFPLDPYMIDEATGERIRYLQRTIPTASIYTMNCPRDFMEVVNYPTILGANEKALSRLFGYSETLYCCDTYQYNDYTKYDCNMFDEAHKAQVRDTQFPLDCQQAEKIGRQMVEAIQAEKG